MNPAARINDTHACFELTDTVPPIPHIGGSILGPGAPTVLIAGQPAATVGDEVYCQASEPATIVTGSSTVLINGKPAARLGDTTSHGGSILTGEITVLIG